MDSHQIFHVAVLPPSTVELDTIQRVASVIDRDLYRTRLLLAGKIPRILAHYSTLQEAELTARNLKDLGLTAIACKDADLRKPSQGFRAHKIEFGQKEIMFWDKRDQIIKMESIDAFLILTGTLETHEDKETITTKMKLNLPVTLLMGGIPIGRKVTEKVTETSIQVERFLRVYGNNSSNPEVEIRQHDFDFSCLGQEIAPSSSVNFSILIERITDAFQQAVFVDKLTGNLSVDLPSITPWGKIDVICKLIYLFEQLSRSLDK